MSIDMSISLIYKNFTVVPPYLRLFAVQSVLIPVCVITMIQQQNVGATFDKTQFLASKISREPVSAKTANTR